MVEVTEVMRDCDGGRGWCVCTAVEVYKALRHLDYLLRDRGREHLDHYLYLLCMNLDHYL
jgi:hypothetical protein